MYSAHNKRKSIVVERFIKTLENNIYKYMTSVSKKVYIDKLDEVFNKYNNICYSTIKMKPSTYINFNKENNKDDPKFEAGDHVRIWNNKNTCA